MWGGGQVTHSSPYFGFRIFVYEVGHGQGKHVLNLTFSASIKILRLFAEAHMNLLQTQTPTKNIWSKGLMKGKLDYSFAPHPKSKTYRQS